MSFLPNNEQQQFLHSLGIDIYIPNDILIREPEEVIVAEAIPPQLAAERPAKAAVLPPVSKAGTSAEITRRVERQQLLVLGCFYCEQWVFFEPLLSDPQVKEQKQLIQNICIALNSNEKLKLQPLKVEVGQEGYSHARGTLTAFLNARDKEMQQQLILMGRHSIQLFCDQTDFDQCLGKNVSFSRSMINWKLQKVFNALIVPSTKAMMQEPELKALTWRTLSHLRKGADR